MERIDSGVKHNLIRTRGRCRDFQGTKHAAVDGGKWNGSTRTLLERQGRGGPLRGATIQGSTYKDTYLKNKRSDTTFHYGEGSADTSGKILGSSKVHRGGKALAKSDIQTSESCAPHLTAREGVKRRLSGPERHHTTTRKRGRRILLGLQRHHF